MLAFQLRYCVRHLSVSHCLIPSLSITLRQTYETEPRPLGSRDHWAPPVQTEFLAVLERCFMNHLQNASLFTLCLWIDQGLKMYSLSHTLPQQRSSFINICWITNIFPTKLKKNFQTRPTSTASIDTRDVSHVAKCWTNQCCVMHDCATTKSFFLCHAILNIKNNPSVSPTSTTSADLFE